MLRSQCGGVRGLCASLRTYTKTKRTVIDLRGLSRDCLRSTLYRELEKLRDKHQQGAGVAAKPSAGFADWRVLVDPSPRQADTLKCALDFFADSGIKLARRGERRDVGILRVSADQLQQAAARMEKASSSRAAVVGTLLKLGFVLSAFAIATLLPRLGRFLSAVPGVDQGAAAAMSTTTTGSSRRDRDRRHSHRSALSTPPVPTLRVAVDRTHAQPHEATKAHAGSVG